MRIPLFWLLIVAIVLAVFARAEDLNPEINKTYFEAYNKLVITTQQIQDWTNDLRGQPNADCELIVTRYHKYCKIDPNSGCTQELQNEYQKCNKMKLSLKEKF